VLFCLLIGNEKYNNSKSNFFFLSQIFYIFPIWFLFYVKCKRLFYFFNIPNNPDNGQNALSNLLTNEINKNNKINGELKVTQSQEAIRKKAKRQ